MSILALVLESTEPAQELTIPFIGAHTLNQSYTPIEAKYSIRTGNGSLITRIAWTGKLSTTLSSQGFVPAGLSALDYSVPLTMSCVGQRAVNTKDGETLTVNLPMTTGLAPAPKWRTDIEPFGRAILADDVWVPTRKFNEETEEWEDLDIDEATGEATILNAVENVLYYQVLYYPELIVMCTPPEEQWTEDAYFGWTLTAQEI